MSTAPIARHESLKPFSRDHHHGLLLCWKIREGSKRQVEPERISKYVSWFWQQHLKQHFDLEEQYIFPILQPDDALRVQAQEEHKRLRNYFSDEQEIKTFLPDIERELDAHIRFEERILFRHIQEKASPGQLQELAQHHTDKFQDDWEDEFWTRSE